MTPPIGTASRAPDPSEPQALGPPGPKAALLTPRRLCARASFFDLSARRRFSSSLTQHKEIGAAVRHDASIETARSDEGDHHADEKRPLRWEPRSPLVWRPRAGVCRLGVMTMFLAMKMKLVSGGRGSWQRRSRSRSLRPLPVHQPAADPFAEIGSEVPASPGRRLLPGGQAGRGAPAGHAPPESSQDHEPGKSRRASTQPAPKRAHARAFRTRPV